MQLPAFARDKKHIAIAVLAVMLVVSVSLMGKAVTSYAAYVDDISGRLNQTEKSLGSCSSSLNQASFMAQECQGNLTAARSSLSGCESKSSSIRSLLDMANADVNKCKSDYSALKTKNDAAQSKYDALAENAAKDICCTRGVVSINWDVVDNFIVCSGPRNATC